MAQSGVIADPQLPGSSRCREQSKMLIRAQNRIQRAGVPPGPVSAH